MGILNIENMEIIRNIKNNVMEHLASNLEQTGTGKGAVLQRRISVEQLQQKGTA